jgi:hypothetical protein
LWPTVEILYLLVLKLEWKVRCAMCLLFNEMLILVFAMMCSTRTDFSTWGMRILQPAVLSKHWVEATGIHDESREISTKKNSNSERADSPPPAVRPLLPHQSWLWPHWPSAVHSVDTMTKIPRGLSLQESTILDLILLIRLWDEINAYQCPISLVFCNMFWESNGLNQ